MAEVQRLLDGLAFGESLRWHQDRLWLADWGAQEVVAVDRGGQPEVMARVDFPAFPMCIDWLPDGRLLVVAARDGRLLPMAACRSSGCGPTSATVCPTASASTPKEPSGTPTFPTRSA